MSQPIQNQQVNRPSAAPKSNPPQPKTNKPARPGEPDAFARLAEAAASAQAYLNNPKAEKTSTRREPVCLVPNLDELPRPASQERDGASPASSLPQTPPSREVQPGRGEDKVAGSASSRERLEGRGSSSTPPLATDPHASAKHQKDAESPASALPEAAVDAPARSAVSSARPASHRPRAPRASTVRQAKNYLRATASPKFLRSAPNLQRHRRKCVICRHPEREMIEELFVRWHSPQAIANFLRDYEEINWVSIYRHAYALGLDAVRRRNLRHFFENLLDDAINATPTFAGVLGAARALGCVTEDGRWVEPEKRILMTTVIRKEDASATTTTDPAVSSSEDDAFGATSSLARLEGGGSASTSLRASFQNRDFAETSGPVPPPQEKGARVHAAHVGAEYDRPEFDRPGFPMQPPAAASRQAGHQLDDALSASLLPQAAVNLPAAAKRRPQPGSPSVVRSGSREIRLPLNSHKTKEKTISNR